MGEGEIKRETNRKYFLRCLEVKKDYSHVHSIDTQVKAE